MLPLIFDLFTQADHGLDRSLGGLGIGLTLVKRLVELHEGKVEARSEGLGRRGSTSTLSSRWISNDFKIYSPAS